MALKTYYIEVMEGYKVIERHTSFNAADANKIVKELKEKFPAPKYAVHRDLV